MRRISKSQSGRRLVEAGRYSDHEEPMGRVTPKLFDQTILPIEVGLHRPGSDIGAFVGPPVAMRRLLLRQNLRGWISNTEWLGAAGSRPWRARKPGLATL